MADLGRWLSEDYRVPDETPPDRQDGGQSGRRDNEGGQKGRGSGKDPRDE